MYNSHQTFCHIHSKANIIDVPSVLHPHSSTVPRRPFLMVSASKGSTSSSENTRPGVPMILTPPRGSQTSTFSGSFARALISSRWNGETSHHLAFFLHRPHQCHRRIVLKEVYLLIFLRNCALRSKVNHISSPDREDIWHSPFQSCFKSCWSCAHIPTREVIADLCCGHAQSCI